MKRLPKSSRLLALVALAIFPASSAFAARNECLDTLEKIQVNWESPFFPHRYSFSYLDEPKRIAAKVELKFINTISGADADADTEGDFVVMYNKRLPWNGYNHDGMGIERASRVALPTLITRFRGKGDGLPDYFAETPFEHIHRREFAVAAIADALRRLRARYAEQGPERFGVINTLIHEDEAKAYRTIHFLTASRNDFFSHAQVLTSRGPEETLNVEDHFGPLEREAGKTWVELGRFRIDSEVPLPWGSEGELRGSHLKSLARLQTLQQVYSYLNHDLKPEGVAMQVNTAVLKVFERQNLLVFDKRSVRSEFAEEWVLTQSPAQRLASEERIVREQLLWNLHRFLKGNAPGFYWRPNRNERDVLRRLGIVSLVSGVETRGAGYTLGLQATGEVMPSLEAMQKRIGIYGPSDSPELQALFALQRVGPGIKREPHPTWDLFYGVKEEGTSVWSPLLAPEEAYFRNEDVALILHKDHATKLVTYLESLRAIPSAP